MMKTILFAAAAACTLAVTSCSLSKKQVDMMGRLDGEWNIVEVNDSVIKPAAGQAPYIGFDMKEGRIYGHTGCNRIMSAIDAKTGKIDFSHMGSTMMACPDMDTERKILDALAKTVSVKECKDGAVALLDGKGNEAVRLEKRFAAMEYAELDGEWLIVSTYGEPVAAGEGGQPALSFDTKNNRLGGNAGCNRIMGGITTTGGKAGDISFGNVATTRMACPDMDTERNVLAALNSVKSFGQLSGGNVALFDSGRNIVLELKKVAK